MSPNQTRSFFLRKYHFFTPGGPGQRWGKHFHVKSKNKWGPLFSILAIKIHVLPFYFYFYPLIILALTRPVCHNTWVQEVVTKPLMVRWCMEEEQELYYEEQEEEVSTVAGPVGTVIGATIGLGIDYSVCRGYIDIALNITAHVVTYVKRR